MFERVVERECKLALKEMENKAYKQILNCPGGESNARSLLYTPLRLEDASAVVGQC